MLITNNTPNRAHAIKVERPVAAKTTTPPKADDPIDSFKPNSNWGNKEEYEKSTTSTALLMGTGWGTCAGIIASIFIEASGGPRWMMGATLAGTGIAGAALGYASKDLFW